MASEIKVDTIVNAGGDNDSGIDLATNDNIKFNIAGSQKAIIDATGNVGINSTTPSTYVDGSDGQTLVLESAGTERGAIVFASECTGGEGEILGLINFTDTANSSTNKRGAAIRGIRGSSDTNPFLTFTTANSEAMRINSSGFVGIGTTNPVNALHVNNSGNTVFCLERSAKSSGSGFAGFNLEGNSQLTISYDDGSPLVIGTASNPSTQAGFTEHFRIANDGTLTATDTSIGSNSDERLKKNIADYTYDLEKFKQYKPKTFDWKNPSTHNGKTGNRGFLAQDVKSIDEKWVGELEITEKNPDYNIIPDNVSLTSKLGDKDTMYISVIQQLITKVETLEARIKKLEDG